MSFADGEENGQNPLNSYKRVDDFRNFIFGNARAIRISVPPDNVYNDGISE